MPPVLSPRVERTTQAELLTTLIDEPIPPLLRRFDGALFTPETVLTEVNRHSKGKLWAFSSDETADTDRRRPGPGRYQFFRYGWLQPIVPDLVELSAGHGARLPGSATEAVARAIAHVDRLFKVIEYRGAWWLYARGQDMEEAPALLAPDYYLLRRVIAMEQLEGLQEALAEAQEEIEALEEGDPDEELEEFPIHVWGSPSTRPETPHMN